MRGAVEKINVFLSFRELWDFRVLSLFDCLIEKLINNLRSWTKKTVRSSARGGARGMGMR